jgi:Peptidase_C39 like family
MNEPVGLSAWLRIVAVCAIAVLAGCAGWTPPQTAALRERAPSGLRERVELGTVPFIAQTPLHCGPSSLAMALQYLGRNVTADALADAVFLPARDGTLQAEMLAGARRHDAVAQLLPGQIETLLRELQAGHPVVVLQNLGLSFVPAWHYAVLVGYDLAREEVVLRSGLIERETMSLRTFEFTWQRAGHWAFVALAPGDLAAADDPRAASDAAVAFERVAAPASAARAYAAVLQRWPDSGAIAAMALAQRRRGRRRPSGTTARRRGTTWRCCVGSAATAAARAMPLRTRCSGSAARSRRWPMRCTTRDARSKPMRADARAVDARVKPRVPKMRASSRARVKPARASAPVRPDARSRGRAGRGGATRRRFRAGSPAWCRSGRGRA